MHVRIHSVGKKFPRFQEFKEKVGPAKFCYLVKSTLARNVRLTKKKYLQRIMKFLEDSAIIEEKIAKTKG